MRIGVVNEETWAFLNEIYAEFQSHHNVDVFERRTFDLPILHTRLNRRLLHHDLLGFMHKHDVVFFEWASHLLATVTHLSDTPCGIVTRLHRYEMYEWVDRINWDRVDAIILVSQAKKREFLTRFPEQAAKVMVIPEAVDVNKFQPIQKQYTGNIGILCHLTPRKRVYELILVFYELLQQRDQFHLHIGGGSHVKHGAYYEAMHYLVEQLDIIDRVTFYGHISDPSNWYHNVDIFISNAYSEGLQVAPIEAMASGCYTLAHHWAGAEELLPEQYLYFTDRQLRERILMYDEVSVEEKVFLQSRMREIVIESFNVHYTKVKIRELTERVGVSAGAGVRRGDTHTLAHGAHWDTM